MKNKIKEFLKKTYNRIFPDYTSELEKAIGDCKTLLDVGCGNNSPIRTFSDKLYSVGVDAFAPSIEKSKKLNIHNEYRQMDILDIDKEFEPDSFDCVLASDLIEHLEKDEGYRLIESMEKIAKKKIIIFTPNGFLPQGEYDNNPWQLHKSGWEVEEMKAKGYEVIGINGMKALRGEYAAPKYRPFFFWSIISDITQLFVRNKPEKAFQILCVKTKNN